MAVGPLGSTPDDPYILADPGFAPRKDLKQLADLIEAVAGAGADGVNLRAFRTDYLISAIHREDAVKTYRELQLSRDQLKELAEVGRDNELQVLLTAYDPEILAWGLDELEPTALYLDAGDLNYRRLVRAYRETDLDLLIETTGATMTEIEQFREWLGTDQERVGYLHGAAQPVGEERKLNLRRLESLAEQADVVGWADRTDELWSAPVARDLGAGIWNRTVTLADQPEDPLTWGEAITPEQMRIVIERLRTGEEPEQDSVDKDFMLGEADPDWPDEVQQRMQERRRSLMAARSLSAGDSLGENDVRELRPAGGLPPDRVEDCVGLMVPRPTDPKEMISY